MPLASYNAAVEEPASSKKHRSRWVEYAGTAVAEGPTFDVRLISENMGQVAVDDIELTPGACLVPTGSVAAGTTPR